MKKNILKKLAFVLAFAMIFSTLAPAASAFAASKPALSAKSKVLVLNVKGNTSYNFNVSNKVKGAAYKWSSSNTKVATVKSNGVVTAKAIGSTKITVVVTLKSKKIATLVAPVTVKENIKTLTIDNALTKAIAVGAKYNFNVNYTTASKHKTTDIVRFEITKGNEAKVASIATNGVFVSTAAGTFEVTALSFQSATKYAAYLAGDTSVVTAKSVATVVKVEATITKIEQTTPKVMVLYFSADVSKVVTKDNLIVEVNDASKQKQIVEKVEFATADAGLKATVTTYLEFKDGVDYSFNVVDNANLSFVKKASKGVPTILKITGPTTVVFQTETELKVAILDANGVDVGGSDVTYEITAGQDNGYLIGNKVYIFEKGKSITVKAKFNTGKLDATYAPIYLTDEKVIVATDATLAVSSNKFTVAKTAPTNWDNYTVNTQIGSGDSSFKLFVQIKLNDDKTVTSNGTESYNFKYESMDSSKLLVGADGTLVPFGAGTVYVKVTYKEYAPILVAINIGAERKAATWAFESKTLTVSNTTSFVDTATASAIVKDNYGVELKSADLVKTTSAVSSNTSAPVLGRTVTGDKVNFKVTGQGVTAGTYNYTVKYDNLTEYITVIVKDGVGSATSWRLNVGATVKDTARTDSSNGSENVAVELFGYNQYGVAVDKVDIADYSVVVSGPDAVTSGSAISIGRLNAGEFKLVGLDGNVVVKAKAGTYNFVATYVLAGTTHTINTAVVVKDTQVTPVVILEDATVDATTLLAAVKLAFKATVSGTTLDDSAIIGFTALNSNGVEVTNINPNGSYVIKKVLVAQTFGSNIVISEITVNNSITID